jgi:hypothetical protein
MDINILSFPVQFISITYQTWTFKMYNSFGKPLWLSKELATVLFLYHVSKEISDNRFILCIKLK